VNLEAAMPAQTRLSAVHAAALLLVAICLGPAFAHLFELPNKMGLGREDYFTVQQIYRGWALLGAVLVVGGLVSTLTLAVLLRGRRTPAGWAGLAFLSLVAAQILFWSFTFPANQATANWTQVPPDWQAVRARWEYSHAAGAVLDLAAMVALTLSVLEWRAPQRNGGGEP
jgi:hypothetical protein